MVRSGLTAFWAVVSALVAVSTAMASSSTGVAPAEVDQTWTVVALIAVTFLVPVLVIVEAIHRRVRRG